MVTHSQPPAASTADAFDQSHSGRIRSLDVLPFVPDKAAAVREVARILRPGGRFAFTTWEQLTHLAPGDDNHAQRQALAATFHSHPLLQSARIDYRQLTEQAGLTVETYHEPPGLSLVLSDRSILRSAAAGGGHG